MIRLRTLGSLDLRSSSGEELRAVLAQPRRAALLAYLALATPRGTQRRDTVLALFWPELDIDRARNALGQAVHFLRKSIGESAVVNRNGDGLSVDWENFWCDAAAFEEALDANRIDEAVALYRGDLLQGFHIDDAPDFERWLDSERARLAARYTTAVSALAAQREQAGDLLGAAAHWRTLTLRDPYSSRLTLQLMRALKAAGDPAGALLQAREHERLLREELSIAPDAALLALAQQLREAQPDTPARLQDKPAIAAPPTAVSLVEGRALQTKPQPAPPVHRHPRRRILLATTLLVASLGVATAVIGTGERAPRDTNAEVRILYDRGRQAEVNRSFVGTRTAERYYRLAIQRDSTFAPGYAALSLLYALMAHYDFAPKLVSLDSARSLAQLAVALDSAQSETRTALAASLANDGHFGSAEVEFRRALLLDPQNSTAHFWYGMLLVALGRGREALAEAERALELDPVTPRAVLGTKTAAQYLITGERLRRELPPTERFPILKTETGEPWARAQQAVDLAADGRCEEARSDIAIARALVPDSNMVMLAFAGGVDASCGARASAHAILARMKRRSNANDHALRIAILHGWLGEKDSAFVWLGRHRWVVSELLMLSAAPQLDPLRTDKRLLSLMRQLGIRERGNVADPHLAIPTQQLVRDMYVRARNAEMSRNEVGLATARDAYERAIARDPGFVPAYAGLSELYDMMGVYGFMPMGPAMDSARRMARRAFALDSNSSEARTALALSLVGDGDVDGAVREFERAIALRPSDALARYWYAMLLAALGRGADAQREIQSAKQHGLIGFRGVQAVERYAHWLMTGERPYLKLPPRERRPSMQIDPGDPWAIARQAEDLAQVGDCEGAHRDLSRAQRLAPDNPKMRPHMARVDWWCGERARARLLLDDMKRRRDARDLAFEAALMHALFGDTDSAFVWFDKNRWSLGELAILRASPYVDSLRSDPRYPRLLRRIGLEK